MEEVGINVREREAGREGGKEREREAGREGGKVKGRWEGIS